MKTIQSIDKTMLILNCISQSNGKLTLTDLSKQLNMAITTLHGFLGTLEYWQMVQKNEFGRYEIGAKIFQLSLFCSEPQLIRTALHSHLETLAERYQETIHLGLMMGDDLSYVDKAECNQPFRMTSVVGVTVPYYESAIGLMIQAVNAAPIPAPYLADCNNMLQDGYCLKFERDMDAYCVASPIILKSRRCSAGISMVIPSSRFRPEIAKAFTDDVHALVSQTNL